MDADCEVPLLLYCKFKKTSSEINLNSPISSVMKISKATHEIIFRPQQDSAYTYM